MKCFFHIHTFFSKDCNTSLEEIRYTCLVNNVNIVFITDHDTIDGALGLMAIVDKKLRVIVGEEVTTTDGEIIGLFLKDKIAPHKSAHETIVDIQNQNGLVCIPHPFDSFRKEKIKTEVLNKIIDSVDIIEVFNSRNVFNKDNIKAFDFARYKCKTGIVGSDAHTIREIKDTYFDIEPFSGPEDFLLNLKNAKVFTKRSPIFVHLYTKLVKLNKKHKMRISY